MLFCPKTIILINYVRFETMFFYKSYNLVVIFKICNLHTSRTPLMQNIIGSVVVTDISAVIVYFVDFVKWLVWVSVDNYCRRIVIFKIWLFYLNVLPKYDIAAVSYRVLLRIVVNNSLPCFN